MKGPSKRWRPTPQQVRILDGLFRGGVSTPSAQEIQKITSHLKDYGKVESKNVFYWFQNHKAGEKQKLNRKLHLHHLPNTNNNNNNLLFCFAYPHPHYSYGFFPILTPQATNRESVSAPEMRDMQWKSMEKQYMVMKEDTPKESYFDKDNSSSLVTWLATDSDYRRHQFNHHRRTLKTLQLFPTTTLSETTTTTTATSANAEAASASTTSSSSMNNS